MRIYELDTPCCGKNQQGGFIEFCDGHPSQCGGNKNKGSYSKTQFKNLFKKYTKYSINKEALERIHQMVENDLVHYLNKQKKDKKFFNKLR